MICRLEDYFLFLKEISGIKKHSKNSRGSKFCVWLSAPDGIEEEDLKITMTFGKDVKNKVRLQAAEVG